MLSVKYVSERMTFLFQQLPAISAFHIKLFRITLEEWWGRTKDCRKLINNHGPTTTVRFALVNLLLLATKEKITYIII